MEFTQEHEGIRRNVRTFIDKEINPHVDEWEAAGIFPAHELFKKVGDQGYLGINKPAKYGGMGLDLMLKGEDVTMLASMAKLKSGRLSREISDACLQYWGGMGFMNETPISRAYRDTRLGSIGGGADEIMLSIICKHMGILPGKRNR
jgi:alkylation response protein AidB-like acyl-CoA dehydrogenase